MKLSVQEAATLLERSPRTVRHQLASGELPGHKRGGQWRIERRDLPLTEAQRAALQGRADRIRQTVEDALPSRMARSRGQRTRSIADLDAFRRGAAVLVDIRGASGHDSGDEPARERAAALLEQALLDLAEGVQLYDRQLKLAALNRSRAALARSAACLLLEAPIPPADPVFGWVSSIESEVIPAVAGFARWAERLGDKRR